jgi:CheY-like chemotaxis protein/osmotically-inducible protein OsmY
MDQHAEDTFSRIVARLREHPSLADVELAVSLRDGVVTLCGWVETYEQKLAAESTAVRTEGVRAVAVEVAVRGPWDRRLTDTDIAHSVAARLASTEEAGRTGTVRARVERGWVTLEGAVDLFRQRDRIEERIRSVSGVQGVINLIAVRSPESQSDIDRKVEHAVAGEIESLGGATGSMSRHGSERRNAMADKKVLIVDDDDDFRASVRPVLEREGYIVFEAASGREGLTRLGEHEPDLIVVDIMMETGDEGYGFTQAVKYRDEYRRYRNIPVVMVSSIQETPGQRFPMAPELELIQPDAYLTKPLDIDRFVAVVHRALERSAGHGERT